LFTPQTVHFDLNLNIDSFNIVANIFVHKHIYVCSLKKKFCVGGLEIR
jgi:hypothetical protein